MERLLTGKGTCGYREHRDKEGMARLPSAPQSRVSGTDPSGKGNTVRLCSPPNQRRQECMSQARGHLSQYFN